MRTCNVWNVAWFGNMTLTNTNWLERLVETARKLSGRLQDRLLAIYRTHVLGRLRLLSTVVTTHFTESLCHYPPLPVFSWAQREPLPHWYNFVSMVSSTISLSVKHSWTSENICMLGPPSSSLSVAVTVSRLSTCWGDLSTSCRGSLWQQSVSLIRKHTVVALLLLKAGKHFLFFLFITPWIKTSCFW